MLVVDASAVAGWLLPDEGEAGLAALLSAHDSICAPSLLWAELRNILIASERRGRLPAGTAEQFLRIFDGLGVTLDTAPVENEVLRLARQHRLTVYDALYLELAMRSSGVLSTLDRALAAAAGAEGIGLA